MVYDLRDRKWQKPQPKRVIKPELTPPKHVKDAVEFLLENAASRTRKAKPSKKRKPGKRNLNPTGTITHSTESGKKTLDSMVKDTS